MKLWGYGQTCTLDFLIPRIIVPKERKYSRSRLWRHRFTQHLVYDVRYTVVPIISSLLSITLYPSVITSHAYNDSKCLLWCNIFNEIHERTAGYIWTDYKTNAQIAKELRVTPILNKLPEYKRKWIQHVNRMPRNRLPRVMKHYSPTGRRNHGKPLKRLLDTWVRNGSTSGPTSWQIYDDDIFNCNWVANLWE
jgi:hypothetical protein